MIAGPASDVVCCTTHCAVCVLREWGKSVLLLVNQLLFCPVSEGALATAALVGMSSQPARRFFFDCDNW